MTEGMTKLITRILVVVLAKRLSSTCISSKASLNQNLQSDPSIPNLQSERAALKDLSITLHTDLQN